MVLPRGAMTDGSGMGLLYFFMKRRVYISQRIRFARVCSNVDDLTTETYF